MAAAPTCYDGGELSDARGGLDAASGRRVAGGTAYATA